jgi:hypothetical protein
MKEMDARRLKALDARFEPDPEFDETYFLP